MKINLTILLIILSSTIWSQFSDDFADGDFTTAPVWSGEDFNFEIDEDQKLHLNAPAEADTSYLSVASTILEDVSWTFLVNMDFNPSSSNYTRVYVVSDNANLKGALNGYFVLIGNTADEISLYKQSGLVTTEIIDGLDGAVDDAAVNARVKVTRDAIGNWELFRDTTGGTDFLSEGTTMDITHTTTTHFGVFCKYTSTRSDLFFFDDLGTPYVDNIPPTILDVVVVSDTEIDVLFNEAVDAITATDATNYSINLGIGSGTLASIDIDNPALVHLTFGVSFENGTTYTLNTVNVEDLSGNIIDAPTTNDFLYFVPEAPSPNDIVISEIFADPSPIVGLPEVEYIEIYNRSNKYFDLNDWTINDNTSEAEFGSYIFGPDEYLLICGTGNGALFGIDNNMELVGLPTLTNGEDYLVLKTSDGEMIDSVYYFQSWYGDNLKDDGGWSLERKHLNAPCSDQNNWAASINPNGGTPGVQNSIWTDVDDIAPPFVQSYTLISNEEVLIRFNESMDTNIAAVIDISPSVSTISSFYAELNELIVDVITLEENTSYLMTIKSAEDCWGNPIDQFIKFGLPGEIEPEDIILNEILFDPKTGGSDYVELYNNSNKILNLEDLLIGSWDDFEIGNLKSVSATQQLILPGEYFTLTEDSTDIINDFSVYGIGRFLEIDLPTYPNDSGTVFLLRKDSLRIDYFHYDSDYHYPLISNVDGKALERITFGGGMNNKDNWHTASESVEWGTPGYQNSQYLMVVSGGDVFLEPQIFSPDNDGFQDVISINLKLDGLDNLVDVNIYDNQGRLIRELKDNYFVGNEDVLFWDGINDLGTKAAIGTYIILVNVQTSNGDNQVFKLVAVLAGQL